MTRLGRISVLLYKAIGRVRSKCFSLLISGSFANFGKHTVIMPPVRLSGECRITLGHNIFVGEGSWLQTLSEGNDHPPAIFIGDRTSIAGACVISAARRVTIENDVLLARNVYISDHMHRHTSNEVPILRQGLDKIQEVKIKSGAWLGQNVVICPGVTVGHNAVVGANSVVTRDIPDFAVAVGAPARVVKVYSYERPHDRETLSALQQ